MYRSMRIKDRPSASSYIGTTAHLHQPYALVRDLPVHMTMSRKWSLAYSLAAACVAGFKGQWEIE